MASPGAYEAMAMQALMELATTEGAFVAPEAEAKIADQKWATAGRRVDPHHITAALNQLISGSALESTTDRTRGGREIKVFHLPSAPGITRKIAGASARKRLLHARYQSWASGSKHGGGGAVGPGLEFVIHHSLQEAAQFGYRLFNPTSNTGEVRELFGEPVPGGSLDNGGWLTVTDPETFIPVNYLMVLEAKNLRQWIYPRTQELHQLLSKASAIQVSHPDQHVVPVLVCRRAHYLTTVMARELGFYVIQTQHQYVRPFLVDNEEGQRHLAEVNDELAYDLIPQDEPVEPMVRHFRKPLQDVASRTAALWSGHAEATAETFATLRDDSLSYAARATAMDDLAYFAADALGEPMTWRSAPEDDSAGDY